MRCIQVFAICIGLCATGQAHTQQVSTLDAQYDLRLAHKVAVRAEGLPVGELLPLLTQKTGVTFTVQKDIADDKIILFSPSRPLRDTLADIAALFNDTWERSEPKGEPIHYRLIRSPRAREYEEELANGPIRRLMAQLDERAATIAQMAPPANQTPGVPTHAERSMAANYYLALDVGQKQQLFAAGHTSSIAFSTLPPGLQTPLRDWFTGFLAQQERSNEEIRKRDEANPRPDGHYTQQLSDPGELEHGAVRFTLSGNPLSGSVNVRMQISRWGILPVASAQTDVSQLPLHGNPYTRALLAKNATLPTRQALQNAAHPSADWIKRLQTLAEQTHTPVLSDYYRCALPENMTAGLPLGNGKLSDLDVFCAPAQRLWWVRGSSLLLRTRDWYVQAQYEVPDAWMQSVIGSIKTHDNAPTYQDLFRTLELTPRQLRGLVQALQGFAPQDGPSSTFGGSRPLLLLLKTAISDVSRSLPNTDMDFTMQKKEEVRLAELTPEAHAMLPEVFADLYPLSLTGPDSFVVGASCSFPVNRAALTPSQKSEAMKKMVQIYELGYRIDREQDIQGKRQLEKEYKEGIAEQRHLFLSLRKPEQRGWVYVGVSWQLGVSHPTDQTGEEKSTHVSTLIFDLPLLLPNDHRDQTKIEMGSDPER